MDYTAIRKILQSIKTVTHPRGYIVKTQKARAQKIVHAYLEQMRRQNEFFSKMRETISKFLRI